MPPLIEGSEGEKGVGTRTCTDIKIVGDIRKKLQHISAICTLILFYYFGQECCSHSNLNWIQAVLRVEGKPWQFDCVEKQFKQHSQP